MQKTQFQKCENSIYRGPTGVDWPRNALEKNPCYCSSSTIFFQRSFLCQIATIRVRIIKYQSKIFSQGFQNCPRIWNWCTGDWIMTSSSTIFFKRSFLCQIATIRVRIIKYQSKIFSPRIPKLPSKLKLVHRGPSYGSSSTIFFQALIFMSNRHHKSR